MSKTQPSDDVIDLHLASQYLAAAGKSFIEERPDDSHTSMVWDSGEQTLWTQALNEEGLKLGLNVAAFALDLYHPLSDLVASYPMKGARHLDIVNWMERERSFCGLDRPFVFDLHYDLPYDLSFEDSFTFQAVDGERRTQHASRRSDADKVLHGLVKDGSKTVKSEVRVWPHHFDTGLLLQSEKVENLQFSLGMAMPDEVCSDWYYYVSAYRGEDAVDVKGLDSLLRMMD